MRFKAPDGQSFAWNGSGEPTQADIDQIVNYWKATPRGKSYSNSSFGSQDMGQSNAPFDPLKQLGLNNLQPLPPHETSQMASYNLLRSKGIKDDQAKALVERDRKAGMFRDGSKDHAPMEWFKPEPVTKPPEFENPLAKALQEKSGWHDGSKTEPELYSDFQKRLPFSLEAFQQAQDKGLNFVVGNGGQQINMQSALHHFNVAHQAVYGNTVPDLSKSKTLTDPESQTLNQANIRKGPPRRGQENIATAPSAFDIPGIIYHGLQELNTRAQTGGQIGVDQVLADEGTPELGKLSYGAGNVVANFAPYFTAAAPYLIAAQVAMPLQKSIEQKSIDPFSSAVKEFAESNNPFSASSATQSAERSLNLLMTIMGGLHLASKAGLKVGGIVDGLPSKDAVESALVQARFTPEEANAIVKDHYDQATANLKQGVRPNPAFQESGRPILSRSEHSVPPTDPPIAEPTVPTPKVVKTKPKAKTAPEPVVPEPKPVPETAPKVVTKDVTKPAPKMSQEPKSPTPPKEPKPKAEATPPTEEELAARNVDTNKARADVELDPHAEAARISKETTKANAKKLGYHQEGKALEIADRVNGGGGETLNREQQAGLTERMNELSGLYKDAKERFDSAEKEADHVTAAGDMVNYKDQLDRITQALNKGGSEVGGTLGARRGNKTYSFQDQLALMTKEKGSKLTDTEFADLHERTAKIEEHNKALSARIAELEKQAEEAAKASAARSVQDFSKAKSGGSKASKTTTDVINDWAKSIKSAAAEPEFDHAGEIKLNTGVTPEDIAIAARETAANIKALYAHAPHVIELAKRFARELGPDLNKVTTAILDAGKQAGVANLTEKDVHRIIKGDYTISQKTETSPYSKVKTAATKAVSETVSKVKSDIKRFETQTKTGQVKATEAAIDRKIKSRQILENEGLKTKAKTDAFENDPIVQDLKIKEATEQNKLDAVRSSLKAEKNMREAGVVKHVMDALDIGRTFKSAFDLNRPFSQDFHTLITTPEAWRKGVEEGFKGFNTPHYENSMARLRIDPEYNAAIAGKVDLAMDGPSPDFFPSQKASKLWGIRQSSQSFTAGALWTRLEKFKSLHNKLKAASKGDGIPMNARELQLLGSYVNQNTGKSMWLKHLGKFADVASHLQYAPGYKLSKFESAVGASVWKALKYGKETGNYRVAKILAGDYAKGVSRTLLLMYATKKVVDNTLKDKGWEYVIDPRSTDFGRMVKRLPDGTKVTEDMIPPQFQMPVRWFFQSMFGSPTDKTRKGFMDHKFDAFIDSSFYEAKYGATPLFSTAKGIWEGQSFNRPMNFTSAEGLLNIARTAVAPMSPDNAIDIATAKGLSNEEKMTLILLSPIKSGNVMDPKKTKPSSSNIFK